MKKRRNQSIIIILLFLTISTTSLALFIYVSFVPYPWNPFTIVPPFEGLNAGIEGVEINGVFYRIDESLPSGYKYLASDPRVIILQRDRDSFYQVGQVRIEIGQPREVRGWFVEPKKIHYWVKVSDNPFRAVEVEGEIVTYELYISVSAINVFGIDEWFSGERIWFTLSSLTWNKAFQKVGAEYGQAWEAPLAMVIEEFRSDDQGEHYKVEPSLVGRWFTLYNEPRAVGVVSDLGIVAGVDLNSSLAGDPSPDTRIKRTAYFSIQLSDFGVTEHILWTNVPSVQYKLKIYALRIGKFTYTNPDNTPWQWRKPEDAGFIEPLLQWISETFDIPLSIAGWFLLGVFMFIIFCLALIFIIAVAVRLGISKGVDYGG